MHALLCIISLLALLWTPPAAGAAPDETSPAGTHGDGLEIPLLGGGSLECDSAATIEELLASAREMFVSDNYALSEQLYRCALVRDPAHVSAMLELSVVYETAGRLEHAYTVVAKAARLMPFDEEIIERKRTLLARISDTLESEADELLARESYKQALPKLAALLERRPGDPELHYKRARCYLGLGDAAGAIVEIDKAAAIRYDIRYSVLRTHALRLDRDKDIDALVREVRKLEGTGAESDRERALALLSQILARDPEHEWAKNEFLSLGNGRVFVPAEESQRSGDADAGARATRAASSIRVVAEKAWRFLEKHAALAVIAFLVFVLFASPLTSTLMLGFPPRAPISGRLRDFHVQEVLSLVHSQAKSGVLRIRSRTVKARVYFVGGEIYHCVSGKKKGQEAVRDVLARANDGFFVMTRLPRSFKRTVDTPFSLALMDVGERSFLERKNAVSASSSLSRKKSRMKSLLEEKS